jgi:hypothetical protein
VHHASKEDPFRRGSHILSVKKKNKGVPSCFESLTEKNVTLRLKSARRRNSLKKYKLSHNTAMHFHMHPLEGPLTLIFINNTRAAPFSGAEEQTARDISAHVQCACLLSLQMGSIN